MRNYVKLIVRSPVFCALSLLLLTVGIAFSTTGVLFFQSAYSQSNSINSAYTTSVIPTNPDFPGFMPMVPESMGLQELSLQDVMQNSSVDYRLDTRILLGAVVENTTSWTTAASDIAQYKEYADTPYSVSVFAVKCVQVDTSEQEILQTSYHPDGTTSDTKTVQRYYQYLFAVEQPLCYMDRGSYIPESLIVGTYICKPDGTQIFEQGKTYIIRGMLPLQAEAEEPAPFQLSNGAVSSGTEEVLKDGIQFETITEQTLPLFTEYTGILSSFLDSDKGKQWTQGIIPAIAQNYHSAKIMLTDNINSIYWFGTQRATILEGRPFTQAEYSDGSSVCLISANYAEMNNLSVGDTLSMNLFHPAISSQKSVSIDKTGAIIGSTIDTTYLSMDPCLPENEIGCSQTYTIVGIYTAPAYTEGTYAFGADMIFAPKSSVPDVSQYEEDGRYIPLLNSAIIQNGTEEKLLEYLKRDGHEDDVILIDQGYSDVQPAIDELVANGIRLMAVGVAAFVLTLSLFLLLSLHKMSGTTWILRRLGQSKKECLLQMQWVMLPLLAIASVAGMILCICVYDRLANAISSLSAPVSIGTLSIELGIKFVIMVITEVVCINFSLNKGLMKQRCSRRTKR